MKALVIYDSVFGNTEKIAQAVGGAVAASVVRVGEAAPGQLAGLDLLLVGSPTRGFRPTPALTDFLKTIPAGGLRGVKAAAFDTRIPLESIKSPVFRFIVKLGGWAAPLIAKQLQARGAALIQPPEGFFVLASEGPLQDGELERAAEWGRRCAG